MPRRSDAREKMVQTAAGLYSRRGVEGTSFNDVIRASRAPRGSIYHHFPRGKSQLAEEAIRWAGDYILDRTTTALQADDPIAAIGSLRREWAGVLRGSEFEAGCTIVAAALEGARQPTVRDAAAAVFASWEKVLSSALCRRGVAGARARAIATLIVASIEGAIILARAQRSLVPLESVVEELELVVRQALAGRGS